MKWLPVEGYEGRYEVSDDGRVRSLNYLRMKKIKTLKPGLNTWGYPSVVLFDNGRGLTRKVHTLVLEAFFGKCPNGMQAAHFNGIKTCNKITNLAWVTPSTNGYHKVLNNEAAKGEKNGQSKLKCKDISIIRRLFPRFNKCEIARLYKVNHMTIHAILIGRTWGHIK